MARIVLENVTNVFGDDVIAVDDVSRSPDVGVGVRAGGSALRSAP